MTELALAEFVTALPKAELHVHLEGCLEAELLFELAERNQVTLPWRSVAELRAAYQFTDLQSFLTLFFEGCRVLVREQDFYELTMGYLRRAHADGVVRVEAFLGPQTFTERGTPIAEIVQGTLRAMRDAEAELNLSAALLISAQRHRSEQEAFDLLESVLPWVEQIGGFGLGGAEVGNPPSKFRRYFDELHRLGVRTTAHAGEEGPASYVREAVELLGVERLDHGVRALEDPNLTAELAASGIALTVCPISNVKLNGVATLADHPLPTMLEAGLKVTLNSDDPAYFGAYVGQNYLACATQFQLGRAELAQLASNSIAASFQSRAQQQPWLDRLAELAAAQAG